MSNTLKLTAFALVALLIPGSALAAPATLSLRVSGLADDWRMENGIMADIYNLETSDLVKSIMLKQGSGTATDLRKGSTYYVSVGGPGYGSKELIVKMKKSKVSKKVVLKEEESETDGIHVHDPSYNYGTPLYTIGMPVKVGVVVSSAKAGTVEAALVHAKKKIRIPLGTARYTPTTNGTWKSTQIVSAPLSGVAAGGGYYVTAHFKSDDGSITLDGRQRGFVRVRSSVTDGVKGTRTAPEITKFTGPSTLKVGQTGTWTLEATPASGQENASCVIAWGKTPAEVTPQASSFTCTTVHAPHSYSATYKKAGSYYVSGKVVQADQQTVIKWLTVDVK